MKARHWIDGADLMGIWPLSPRTILVLTRVII